MSLICSQSLAMTLLSSVANKCVAVTLLLFHFERFASSGVRSNWHKRASASGSI